METIKAISLILLLTSLAGGCQDAVNDLRTATQDSIAAEATQTIHSSQGGTLTARAGSKIAGSSMIIPANALGIDTTVTMEEAVNLVEQGSLPTELTSQAGDAKVTQSGVPVLVMPEVSTQILAPMTLAIPLPSQPSVNLMQDDTFKLMVVLYRVLNFETNVTETGIIPRDLLKIEGGTAVFTTLFFGQFQTAILTLSIEESIKTESNEAIESNTGKTYFGDKVKTIENVAKPDSDGENPSTSGGSGEETLPKPASPTNWSLSSPEPGTTSSDYTPQISVARAIGYSDGTIAKVFFDAECKILAGSAKLLKGAFTIKNISLSSDGSDDGSINFYGQVVDLNDQVSDCTYLELTYTLDTTPPSPPSGWTLSSPSNGSISNDHTPTITAANLDMDIGSSILIYSDSNCSSFLVTKAIALATETITMNLPADGSGDGPYSFYSKMVDPLGNASECIDLALGYTLDTTAPTAPTGLSLSSPNNGEISNDSTPEISASGLVTENGSSIAIFGTSGCTTTLGNATITGGTFLVNNILESSDGPKSYYGQYTDMAGNQSNCVNLSLSYTLDTIPPVAPSSWSFVSITNGSTSNDNSPQITATGISGEDGSTAEVFDSASCITALGDATISSGTFTINSILYLADDSADGTKFFYGKITDQAGNPTACTNLSLSYTLDTIAPTADFTGAPIEASNNTQSDLNVTIGGAAVVAYKYKVAPGAICSDSTGYSGEHATSTPITTDLTGIGFVSITLCAIGKDSAGNLQDFANASSRTWNRVEFDYGTGSDGDVTISTPTDGTNTTLLSRTLSASARVIGISPNGNNHDLDLSAAFTDNDQFAVGDELMWIIMGAGTGSSCIGSRGKYGFVNVVDINGAASLVTVDQSIPVTGVNNESPTTTTFCMMQILRVPHFNNLTLDATTFSAKPFDYNTAKGGVLVFRVTEALNLNGSSAVLTASGKGYSGGAVDGSGDGVEGSGTIGSANNANGGGGNAGAGDSGRGGTAGGLAVSASVLQNCTNYCDPSVALFMGGGGGGPSEDNPAGVKGGNGGGVIYIMAKHVENGTLDLDASGANGGFYGGVNGDSGGGAGGSIFFKSKSLTNGTPLSAINFKAIGGNEGSNASTWAGGAGGGGLIKLDIAGTCPTNSILVNKGTFNGSGSPTGGDNGWDGVRDAGLGICPN